MKVLAPPETQPWIRRVEATLRTQEQELERLQRRTDQVLTNLRRTAAASSVEDEINASSGSTSGWVKMSSALGPEIQVYCSTGLLRVGVSCWMSGRWTNTAAPATSAGAMTFSVNGAMEGEDLTTEALQSYVDSFSYVVGQPAQDRVVAGTMERYVSLPVGLYHLRAEYLYNHFTTGTQLRWAQRTIYAESV